MWKWIGSHVTCVWIGSEAKCSCGVRVQLHTFWVEMCTGFQSRFENDTKMPLIFFWRFFFVVLHDTDPLRLFATFCSPSIQTFWAHPHFLAWKFCPTPISQVPIAPLILKSLPLKKFWKNKKTLKKSNS